MPAIIDKIADALHLHKHPKHDEAKVADGSADPASTAESSIAPGKDVVVDTVPVTKPKSPVFDSEKVTVLFVLGGPGAGELRFANCRAC